MTDVLRSVAADVSDIGALNCTLTAGYAHSAACLVFLSKDLSDVVLEVQSCDVSVNDVPHMFI